MAKRKDTREIENALIKQTREKRIYGCEEVTIGFARSGWHGNGNEIVDFMTVDSKEEICCYEIKVTLQDLKSDAKKSWYGNYNYLVVSENLWEKREKWLSTIPKHIGIKVGINLSTVTKAIRQNIAEEEKKLLILSITRSMYWKMDKYYNMVDVDKQREQRTQLNYFERECKKSDGIIMYYNELDRYFRYYMKRVMGIEEMDIREFLLSKKDEYRKVTGRELWVPKDPRVP